MGEDRMSEADLHSVLREYERSGEEIARLEAARLERRDEGLRQAYATGWRPVDIQKATGLSREAVRQALNPGAREAARQAQSARRAAQKD